LLSGGQAPEDFKGFARHPMPNPAQCGGTWTSNGDNRPEDVPHFITVIASSRITGTDSGDESFMGDIPILVVVETDQHEGINSDDESLTGTVVSITCGTGQATPTPSATPTATAIGTPVPTPTPTFEGNFVIGDLEATIGNHVTFWSEDWADQNSLSGGSAPDDFKGFALHPSPNPAQCGGTWTSNSNQRPD